VVAVLRNERGSTKKHREECKRKSNFHGFLFLRSRVCFPERRCFC
jgi:hypothetical protein